MKVEILAIALMAIGCGDDDGPSADAARDSANDGDARSDAEQDAEVDADATEDAASCEGMPMVAETACSVLEQDCDDECRPKCTLGPQDDGSYGTVCAAVLGDGAPGDRCARTPRGSPVDDCAAGNLCTFVASSSIGQCRKLCEASTQCGSDEFCALATALNAMPRVGICTPRCDPTAPECPSGSACGRFNTVEAGASTSCAEQFEGGTVMEGASCAGGMTCMEGLVCIGTSGGGSVCARPCDEMHACPDERACNDLPGADFDLCAAP